MEIVLEFLIDGNAFSPSGRGVRAALDVSWKKLDAGEQAAHAAHVIVTIATNFIGEAVQNEHAILKGLQGRHDLFEIEVTSSFLRPISGRNRAVRAEHDDQALAGANRAGQAKAGQADQERQ